jgi:hypothetical protein
MLQHKENCGLFYAITSENHLKYACLNTVLYFTMLYQLLCLSNISKMRW